MNEIFLYTTKYNKSTKPGMDHQTTVKHVKQNKKEKTKTKQKYRRGSKTNKQRSEICINI